MKPGSVIVDMAAAQGGKRSRFGCGKAHRHQERRNHSWLHRPPIETPRTVFSALWHKPCESL
jgi:hypothetical protein